ncbi:DUF2339 domain-containing protein [Nemorincola caseinilytica]|uniref:DUF2339 domain-containing protein n=2 Tax=Nemorincola caseinilytica TaxID=2054315 RepID=A0ABP8N8Y8_9BACT
MNGKAELGEIVLRLSQEIAAMKKRNDRPAETEDTNELSREIAGLRKEIRELRTDLQQRPQATVVQHTPEERTDTPPVYEPAIAKQPAPPVIVEEPIAFVYEAPVAMQEEPAMAAYVADTVQEEPTAPHTDAPKYGQEMYEPAAEEGWLEKWGRNNPDLEKFIGENLINKIGIAILVLGIAFFVKYAIDKEWINEVGRVSIGIGCGMILTGLAHYLRNSYRSFSSVLAGGGIAVFYFTIAFAFHQYHLMSQTAAFVIMVVITGFAVALSVLYDKLELAVIAAVGGFITPFLVSTGEGNYVILFIYLIILNIGLLSLAWFKRWPVINTIALAFTVLIYGAWLANVSMENKPVSYSTALLFATIFYAIFIGMNMVYQVGKRQKFQAFDLSIMLLISGCYYAVGMILLGHIDGGSYKGMFTLGAGFVNLGLAYYVYRRGDADRNLLFLLIGLTLTFLTLTIPIQLHGHAITMFWCAEFVLLYWLSQYSGIRLFAQSSALICLLALISLLMDWGSTMDRHVGAITLIYDGAKGLATNIIAVAAYAGYYRLIRRSSPEGELPGIDRKYAGRIVLTVSIAILYLTCIFGVNYVLQHESGYALLNVYYRIVTGIFAFAGLLLAQRRKLVAEAHVAPLLVCFVFYFISLGYLSGLRDDILSGHRPVSALYAHWCSSVLLAALFLATIRAIRKDADTFAQYTKALSVILSMAIVAFLSVELRQVYIYLFHTSANVSVQARQYDRAGLTVLWALCSFALMWLGMKHREKQLRIISLVLFSVVLLKLFILDISGISEGGKILAFILLGVLLLTVSFMYQRLKKIIFDDTANEK